MARNIGYLTAKKTRSSDECYTPKYGVLPILEFLKAKKFKTVWCPFDNANSEFVKVLKDNKFNVINTHLDNGQDFLTYIPKQNYDVIVSNPPYSIKDKVISKCYSLNKPFMLLMPLPSLQGKNRYSNFVQGLELLVFDGRISYFANGHTNRVQEGNSFASCYFCRNVLPNGLVFRKLDQYKHRTLD